MSVIWYDKNISIQHLQSLDKDTMNEYIGIEWMEIGENFLKAKMPVDHRTKQAYGILHGGASCVLAETIGSVASALVVDHSKYFPVGLEINANHIRSVKKGFVTGIVQPLHLGSTTHVWDIKIFDEEEKLVCVSRHTVVILQRKD